MFAIEATQLVFGERLAFGESGQTAGIHGLKSGKECSEAEADEDGGEE